ncbi:hypothetical protein ABEB36_005973 [Hypothenemus hampei]|uniref:Ig-like domain-containing protein n=1 Tax=Hypothenemus hampei TaxID=57062 RepID=A0ABD1F027_HYPHA
MTVPLPVYYVIPLLLTIALSTACPHSCICKWRNGKQSVECLGQSLLIIPEGIDVATQVLDASGNNLRYIEQDKFLNMGLINLQKLFLNRCEIRLVYRNAFKGLTNLVELDLSENMLEIVPSEALLNCQSLMRLSLSKNPITTLERLAFNHLNFLTTLDLSGCKISEMNEAAFTSLHSLEWIDLSGNKIRSLPGMRLFPNRLKGVQLQNNPWTCDCNIRTFHNWLKRDIIPVLIQPECNEPEQFIGRQIKKLNEEEFHCAPEMSPSSFYFETEVGKNITLLCQVKSVSPAKIRWGFQGQILSNNTEPIPGEHLVYFMEKGSEIKESRLFIYNLNLESNGTFYCLAENSAGVASANYTIMIILKQVPIRFEKEDFTGFPSDLFSILLALGLIMLSLCLVALFMAVLKYRPKSNKIEEEMGDVQNVHQFERNENNVRPTKSILKYSSDQKSFSLPRINDEPDIELSKKNPDIIRGIKGNSKGKFNNSVSISNDFKQKLMEFEGYGRSFVPGTSVSSIQPLPIVTPQINSRVSNKQYTEPYLKPTLAGKHRPVSAPTFERYVEGYRVSRDGIEGASFGKHISLSEKCSPNFGKRIINVMPQTRFDDVQL